jgi:hypothetical protein
MSEISRRGFLKGAQAGLVAAGIVAVAPVTLSAAASAATSKKLEATARRRTSSFIFPTLDPERFGSWLVRKRSFDTIGHSLLDSSAAFAN